MNCTRFDELVTTEALDEATRKECEAHERECAGCRGTLAAVAAYDEAMAHPGKYPRASPEKIRAEVAAIFAKAHGRAKPRTSPLNVLVLAGALAASFAAGVLVAPRVLAPVLVPEQGTSLGGSWYFKAGEAELELGEKDRAREHLKAVATDPRASATEKQTAATLLEKLR
ncbi:MAG TPA: hypothetical protein VFF73_12030 [Planctomycetota bacterium]|nr:hypothetical protein [Planctomycetota bacterium]